MSYLRSEPVQKGRQILVNYSVTVMPDPDPASPSADDAISSKGDLISWESFHYAFASWDKRGAARSAGAPVCRSFSTGRFKR